jgi:hypothetical protein
MISYLVWPVCPFRSKKPDKDLTGENACPPQQMGKKTEIAAVCGYYAISAKRVWHIGQLWRSRKWRAKGQ